MVVVAVHSNPVFAVPTQKPKGRRSHRYRKQVENVGVAREALRVKRQSQAQAQAAVLAQAVAAEEEEVAAAAAAQVLAALVVVAAGVTVGMHGGW